MSDSHATIQEIRNQPKAIKAVLDELQRNHSSLQEVTADASTFCLTGCGTSYFLAKAGSGLLNRSGTSVAVPGSEVFVSPDQIPDLQPDVLIPISRSGESTETVRATDALRDRAPDATVLGITCSEDSSLYQQADVPLLSPKGAEDSVVMTKSFSSMLVALEYLSHLQAGNASTVEAFQSLSADCETVVTQAEALAEELATRRELEKFMFLGTGALYGVAAEAMLKLEEMTLSWTKAYHALEFRHGPRSIADENMLVTVFLPDREQALHRDLLSDIAATDAEILAVGPQRSIAEVDAAYTLPLPDRETPSLVLYAPVFQFLGYYRALANDLNPDDPQNLTQVVTL